MNTTQQTNGPHNQAWVELFNRFVRVSPNSRKERLAGNGYYVAFRNSSGCVQRINFGRDDATAYAFRDWLLA